MSDNYYHDAPTELVNSLTDKYNKAKETVREINRLESLLFDLRRKHRDEMDDIKGRVRAYFESRFPPQYEDGEILVKGKKTFKRVHRTVNVSLDHILSVPEAKCCGNYRKLEKPGIVVRDRYMYHELKKDGELHRGRTPESDWNDPKYVVLSFDLETTRVAD